MTTGQCHPPCPWILASRYSLVRRPGHSAPAFFPEDVIRNVFCQCHRRCQEHQKRTLRTETGSSFSSAWVRLAAPRLRRLLLLLTVVCQTCCHSRKTWVTSEHVSLVMHGMGSCRPARPEIYPKCPACRCQRCAHPSRYSSLTNDRR